MLAGTLPLKTCYPTTMRWIVALVTSLCLVAVAGARPDDALRDPHARATLAAPHGHPSVVARRAAPRHDLRLDPVSLASSAADADPPRMRVLDERGVALLVTDRQPVTVRSRGPPRG